MNTPIYDNVAVDLRWSLDELGPRFGLESALSAAWGAFARDLFAGQHAEGREAEADG